MIIVTIVFRMPSQLIKSGSYGAGKETPNKVLFRRWRDNLLHAVGQVCRKCNDPRRENESLDFNNPLNGSCRCQRVETPLALAADIDTDCRE